MTKQCRYTLFLLVALFSAHSGAEQSRRVYVFDLPQEYWDVVKGDTLSEIANGLLPNQPNQHVALMQAIFEMNPNAFIANDANFIHTGVRLWLPGSSLQTHQRSTPNEGDSTQTFSWGSIKQHN